MEGFSVDFCSYSSFVKSSLHFGAKKSATNGHLYSDLNALKKSAERIKRLGDRTLYYGHGKPTKNRFKILR